MRPAQDPDPSSRRLPRALASPAFRLLWLSMMGANGGRWAFTMMASWLAYALTHSPAWVGLTLFALQVPFVVAAPLTGVLADRFPRQRLLLGSVAVSAGGATLAALLMRAHLLTAPLLAGLAFLLGLGGTMQSTAQNALLPASVPEEALFEAFALQGTARQGAEFVGPAVASPLLALFGGGAALAGVAVLFGLGAVPVGLMPRAGFDPRLTPPPAGRGAGGRLLAEGVRYVLETDLLFPTFLLVTAHCLLTMAYMGLLPSLAAADGVLGSGAYGGLMTTVGLGAVVGTLAVAALGRRAHPGRLLALLSALSGLGVAALGLATGPLPLEGAAFGVGGATAAFMAVVAVRIQETTAEAMRGRVTSLYLMLAGGAMAVGNWLYGLLAGPLPVRAMPVLTGLTFLVLVLAGVAWWAPTRRLYGVLRPLTEAPPA